MSDYTTEDVPFDEDDFVMPNAKAIDKTPEQVAAEGAFKPFPVGFQTVVVVGFDKPNETTQLVKYNGENVLYSTNVISVHFASLADRKVIIKDFFHLIPGKPEHIPLYQGGKFLKDNGEEDWGAPGRESNKFYHFMNALGFDYPPGGMLPREALSLRNWKGRKINLEVQPPKPYPDKKTGIMKPGFPRIKMYSYARYAGTDVVPDPALSAPQAGTAKAPAAPVENDMLDDL